MSLIFKWDSTKASSNEKKHGVSFQEAATAFMDPFSLTIHDPDHSDEEDRFILMGRTFRDRDVVIVHTYRDDQIRIISARRANRREKDQYEKQQ